MKMLKTLPFRYTGELHEVHLVNFSVDMEEVRPQVPSSLRIRDFDGRALISMVDVRLRNMRLRWLPFRFHYQHVGFRLLVEDRRFHDDGRDKGVFFLRSFTNKPLIVAGGKLLTEFRLEKAQLLNHASGLELRQGRNFLYYNLAGPVREPDDELAALQDIVGSIDRAYAETGGALRVTRIMREKWPLQAMRCNGFETNFFRSARLEGVFRVPETIHYTWLPSEPVTVAREAADPGQYTIALLSANEA